MKKSINMDLYQLKVFYYVKKSGSFTKAAAHLKVTQPSITRLMNAFEKELGIKLINKIGKKIVITSDGEKVFELAKPIFGMEKTIENEISNIRQQKSGLIKIFSTETFVAYYMADIYARFREQYDSIDVSVSTFPSYYVISHTKDFDCDFGIITNNVNVEDPKLQVINLLREKIILVGNPDSPLTQKNFVEIGELNNMPIIMFENRSNTKDAIQIFKKKNNLEFKTVCTFSNSDAVKSLVKKGLGYAFISKKVVKEEIQKGELKFINIEDEALYRTFYLIYCKDKYFSQPLRNFIEIMMEWSKNYSENIIGM
jgi:LysR family transcriptional regulator, transcriptional activator of the cysJI operon